MARIRPRTELKAGSSTVSGTSAAPIIGSGAMQAQAATTVGSSQREITGDGVLQSADSTVSGTDATGLLIASDLQYAPAVSQPAFVSIAILDAPPSPVVRVNNKVQTVLRTVNCDGVNTAVNLPKHPALVLAGLTDTWVDEYVQMIEVELSNVVSGDTTITVDDVDGSLEFTVGSDGDIYFIDAVSGDNANSGAIGAPWETHSAYTNSVGADGDIIYLRAGTHTGAILYDGNPSGGSASAPKAILGYPGEDVIFAGTDGRVCASSGGTYLTYGKIDYQGSDSQFGLSGGAATTGVRCIFNRIAPTTGSGGGVNYVNAQNHDLCEILLNEMLGAGQAGADPGAEGVYIKGNSAASYSIWVLWNYIHDGDIKQTVDIYNSTVAGALEGGLTAYVSYNLIDSMTGYGSTGAGIVFGGKDFGADAWVGAGEVYANTIRNMQQKGIDVRQPNESISGNDPSVLVIDVRWNACYDNAEQDIHMRFCAAGSQARDNSTDDTIIGEAVTDGRCTLSDNLTWPDIGT